MNSPFNHGRESVAELSYGDPDSENLLTRGDNLDALKALLPYYARGVFCYVPACKAAHLDLFRALRHESGTQRLISGNTRPPPDKSQVDSCNL